MEKYIFDESNGLWYELNGDYYIPCFTLPEVEIKEIGVWGMWHEDYLKSCRKATYNRLSFEGKLNSYLFEINAQAEEMFDNLTASIFVSALVLSIELYMLFASSISLDLKDLICRRFVL